MSCEDWDDVIASTSAAASTWPRRFPGHERTRLGPDRQHRLDQRPGRPIRPGQLCRRQVRHPRLHQGAGAGRRARSASPSTRSRPATSTPTWSPPCPRRAREDRRQDPGRPARPRRGDRPRRRLPVRRRMPASSPARRCRSTAASTCIDARCPPRPPLRGPVKRSVKIAGHETSISLEPIFWDASRGGGRARDCRSMRSSRGSMPSASLRADPRPTSQAQSACGCSRGSSPRCRRTATVDGKG